MHVPYLVGAIGAISLPNIALWSITELSKTGEHKKWRSLEKKPENDAKIVQFLYRNRKGGYKIALGGLGYASYIVFITGRGFSGPAKLPLLAYGTTLLLNFTFPPLFYRLEKIRMAFFTWILIAMSSTVTGILFHKVSGTAGKYALPYFFYAWLAANYHWDLATVNADNRADE